MAAILNQINGVLIPPVMQWTGEEIPHQGEPSTGSGRNRASTVNRYTGNTLKINRDPEGNHNGNERSHSKLFNSQNHSHQGNHQNRNLLDDLNSRLQEQDLCDKLNKCCTEHDPLYLHQRMAGTFG